MSHFFRGGSENGQPSFPFGGEHPSNKLVENGQLGPLRSTNSLAPRRGAQPTPRARPAPSSQDGVSLASESLAVFRPAARALGSRGQGPAGRGPCAEGTTWDAPGFGFYQMHLSLRWEMAPRRVKFGMGQVCKFGRGKVSQKLAKPCKPKKFWFLPSH